MPDWLNRTAMFVGYWTLAAIGLTVAWCMAMTVGRWWVQRARPWFRSVAPRVTLREPWDLRHEVERERMRLVKDRPVA